MKLDEIRNPRFYPTGRGTYKITEVNDYVKAVSESFEMLLNECASFDGKRNELFEKIDDLTKQVEAYKLDEDNIKVTLLNAQRMAVKTINKANEEAKRIIDEGIEKNNKDAADIKARAEKYAAGVTDKADEYLRRTKTDYETKLSSLNAKAEQIISEANSKAEYIVSDAKIRSAAAIEKANGELTALKDSCESLTRLTQKNLNEIKTTALSYKNEITKLIAKQSEAVDAMIFTDFAAPSVDSSIFAPVHSEVSEQTVFEPQKFEQPEPEKSPVMEQPKPVFQQEPSATQPKHDDEPKRVFNKNSVFINTPDEVAEPEPKEIQQPSDEAVTKWKFDDFVNISSSDDSDDKEVEEQSEPLTYEQATAQPDLLDILSKRAEEEPADICSEIEDITEPATEPESEPEEDDSYSQPTLFENTKRGDMLKEKMDRFLSGDGVADIPASTVKVTKKKDEPLLFGKEFDIFDDDGEEDTFFDKYKKRK